MITKLIIELLEYAVTEYKANEIFIDRTENEDLIIDCPKGRTPCTSEFFANGDKTALSPLGKLAASSRDMTVLTRTTAGDTERLWICGGKLEFSEKVPGRTGSRVTLCVPLSDADIVRIREVCEELAVIHLGVRFEINDAQNADHREISFEDLSEYLEYKLGRIKSPIKTISGFADNIRYELCFTTKWRDSDFFYFLNGKREDAGVFEYLLSQITGQCPVRCGIGVALITQGDPTRSAMAKMESVLFDSILLYLKNQFVFGIEQLDYSITMDLLNELYPQNTPYAFAIAAANACAETESSVATYSPLVIYGDQVPGKLKRSISNAYEIKYRSNFPHHSIFHAARGNIWQLLHEEDTYDCILFVEDFEDAVSVLTWEEQRDLGRILAQRINDRKMTLVVSKNRPCRLMGVADPLWVSINKGMCCELGL